MHITRSTQLLAAGCLIAGLAACGGSSRSAAPTTSPTTAASAATTTSLGPSSTAVTSTSAAPSTTGTAGASFSAVTGTYVGGTADAGQLYIRSDGAARFSGPDTVSCPSCSTASAPIATLDFSLNTLHATGAGAYSASGTITAESDAAWAAKLGTNPAGAGPVGTAVSLTVSSGGDVALNFLPANDVLTRVPAD